VKSHATSIFLLESTNNKIIKNMNSPAPEYKKHELKSLWWYHALFGALNKQQYVTSLDPLCGVLSPKPKKAKYNVRQQQAQDHLTRHTIGRPFNLTMC